MYGRGGPIRARALRANQGGEMRSFETVGLAVVFKVTLPRSDLKHDNAP